MNEGGLRDLALAVFGRGCRLGVVRIGSVDPGTLPDVEAVSIKAAVPARAHEFAAGRAAARQALGGSGPIPMGPDRAPVWPRGWSGSITHAAGWALAVARRGESLMGIDLEQDIELPHDLLSEILTPDEARHIGGNLRVARRVFAIKEAVFKAQYPVTREVFDFQMLNVTLAENRFSAAFQHSVGPFRRGEAIAGAWASGGGLVLAGVPG